jgi:hypothetical protein
MGRVYILLGDADAEAKKRGRREIKGPYVITRMDASRVYRRMGLHIHINLLL